MGFSLELALRYMRSKKRAFVSVGTMFAVLGVTLGVAALATVMSVTGGFREQFRDKVLGVNAHVLVLKYTTDFHDYRDVMGELAQVPGVIGIAPFVINPMMVTHLDRTATGVLLKGVDPVRMPQVLDLPEHLVEGSLEGLRLPGSKPPQREGRSYRKPKSLKGRLGAIGEPSSATEPSAKAAGATAAIGEDAQRAAPTSTLEMLRQAMLDDEATGDAGENEGAAGGRGAPTEESPGDDLDSTSEAEVIPVGSVVPEGGYGSELPEDDYIPEDVDPDPCRSPEARAKLPGAIIGSTLKKNLNVELGGCIQVTSPTIGFSYNSGRMRAPVAKQFRVTGVFDAGFDQYDSKLVYADLYEAQAFYDAGDTVTGIEMKVSNIEETPAITKRIDAMLPAGLYRTMDWEELNHGLFTALRIQQIMMSLVLALIIVVAAFTVVATLIMVVLDKKKEIAVLKSMGASDASLLRAFLYQGGLIGVIGTVLGLGLGVVVCKGLLVYSFPLDPKVYFISRLPVEVEPMQFLLVGLFAVLVCLGACVWPAFYAARLRPAEAFREQ